MEYSRQTNNASWLQILRGVNQKIVCTEHSRLYEVRGYRNMLLGYPELVILTKTCTKVCLREFSGGMFKSIALECCHHVKDIK